MPIASVSSCGQRPQRSGTPARALARALAGATLVLALSACAGLQPLPTTEKPDLQGAWLELTGPTRASVAPGVVLELPSVPYRARFADAKGIYYQASASLVYRTQHGIASEVVGGLYLPHADPTQALVWHEPLFGSATMPYPNRWPVKRRFPSGG